MKPLSSLLLASLCSLSSWSVLSRTSSVTQTPGLSVMEGEAVNINCCWRVTFEKMTLTWLKNQTLLKTERHSLMTETKNCSDLTLTRITRDDSATYMCKVTVEIPDFEVFKGNGTVITVMARDHTNNNTTGNKHQGPSMTSRQLPVIISLPAVTLLLLIALVGFCSLRWRKAQAAMVIYEVPHIDSEVADTDKHNTSSSRGSSQWCQVAVYESLDYFERVQTKESG